MSAVLPPGAGGIPRELVLDAEGFQKLLVAAWVIQCEQDRLVLDSAISQPSSDQLKAWEDLDCPRETSTFTPVVVVPHDDYAEVPVKFPPARVEEIGRIETTGALALVPEIRLIAAARDEIRVDREILEDSAPAEIALAHRRGSGLVLVRRHGQKVAQPRTIRLLRSVPAASVLAAILAVVGLIAFVAAGFRYPNFSFSWMPVFASSSQPMDTAMLEPGSPVPLAPLVESSHLRSTDLSVSSDLEELSRYEIRSLRRQAEYGDAGAALTLGIAYETGEGTTQSCAQAAHWIQIAAEDGDAAAEYNLGLRYVYGDGTPINHDAARKWLHESAGQGYPSAQFALQHLDF